MGIAFIAPYEGLQAMALELVAERKYPIRVYLGDMAAGSAAARRALQEGAKVLVSRGGTALHIRETLGVDVLEVRPSVYSAFAFIYSHTTPESRIAVAGFTSLVTICRPICDILHRRYAAFELQDAAGCGRIMDSVQAWEPDIVIGDVISVRLAKDRALNFHLIESSRETLIDAFEQSALMLSNLDKHLAGAKKLSVVLNCAREGALLLGGNGLVEEINRRGCDLLRIPRERLLGKSFHEIFPSQEIREAIDDSVNLKNALVTVRGKRFVLDLVSSPPDMEANSAVILFQRVEHIQQTETSIRSKLLDKGFRAKYTFRDIIHKSPVMRERIKTAREYAKTDCNIMIQGETGTGKELFAQSIHNAGSRADGPFVAVNCAALPGSLLESELFGYAPGAFTGALRSGKTGLFELARNGTLFLDEVAEMDIFFQSKLLRTLQAKEIMRIGDDRVIPVNVRIIAATNRQPQEEVRLGRMRPDLYFRLNVLDLAVPPLRERRNDASLLFAHYLNVYGKKYGAALKSPSRRFLQALDECLWPGNVRELENLTEKYVTLRGLPVEALPLGRTPAQPAPGAAEPESLDSAVSRHIREALQKEGGNIARAAARLRVDRNTIKRRLAKSLE
jgi:transcriptional regulator with PAS, ATPase and Fis domain